jgi:succinate dehydrogenase/fumarate reductase cytochrome b subunit
MKTFKYLSIKQKLTGLMMFITGVILVMASVLLIFNELVQFRREMMKELGTLAKSSAAIVSHRLHSMTGRQPRKRWLL